MNVCTYYTLLAGIMNDQPEVVSLAKVYIHRCMLCSRGRVITLDAVHGILFRFRNTHMRYIRLVTEQLTHSSTARVCTVFFSFYSLPRSTAFDELLTSLLSSGAFTYFSRPAAHRDDNRITTFWCWWLLDSLGTFNCGCSCSTFSCFLCVS